MRMEQAKTWRIKMRKINITIQFNTTKMINFGYVTGENTKEHNGSLSILFALPFILIIT